MICDEAIKVMKFDLIQSIIIVPTLVEISNFLRVMLRHEQGPTTFFSKCLWIEFIDCEIMQNTTKMFTFEWSINQNKVDRWNITYILVRVLIPIC